MGWNSANPIFDETARAVLNANIGSEKTTDILTVLIDQLRDGDWDTLDESINEFRDEPAVIAAFRLAVPDYFEEDDED